MVASPSATPNDPWERLARLEQVVFANGNQTFFSAAVGAGGLAINNGGGIAINGGTLDVTAGGVDKFHIGSDQTTIRDQANDVVFSDDIVAGWGMTQPNVTYPLYPNLWAMDGAGGLLFIRNTSTYPGGQQVIAAGQQIINHSKLNMSYRAITFNGSATTTATYSYFVQQTIAGSGAVTIDGPHTVTTPPSSFAFQNFPFTYLWPTNIFGQLVNIAIWGQALTGQATIACNFNCSIDYCYGSGR